MEKNYQFLGSYNSGDLEGGSLNVNNWNLSAIPTEHDALALNVYGDAYLVKGDKGWLALDSEFKIIEESCLSRNGLFSEKIVRKPSRLHLKLDGKLIVIGPNEVPRYIDRVNVFEKDSLLFLGDLHKQFGHQITEGLRYVWPVCRHDELKGIEFFLPGTSKATKFQWLLSAIGLDPDNEYNPNGLNHTVVKVNKLYVPVPGMSLFGAYHNAMSAVYESIYEHAINCSSIQKISSLQKIFLDRRSNKRPCKDLEQIKSVLLKNGFYIVASESYPLVDEIALIGRAKCVIGLAGSDMHMTQFNSGGNIGIISHNKFVAPDYISTSAINNNRIAFILGRMDEMVEDRLVGGFSLFDDKFTPMDFASFVSDFSY